MKVKKLKLDMLQCSCANKIFPLGFRPDEIYQRTPEMYETEYYCAKCNRHLGDECHGVDEDASDWCPRPGGGRMSGKEYVEMFERFNK